MMLAGAADRPRRRAMPPVVGSGHMERRIVHIDMDAFYASVEQRDHPELRNQPVVVGSSSRRAVVAAASYEARRFGVRSAMPMFRARRLCPTLLIVDLRMDHYRVVSGQIHAILARHTDLIEPLALDECFLDVSEQAPSVTEAAQLARTLKDEIREETGLTASAGVGANKFVAKLASSLQKPDGLVVVPPEEMADFLAPLPVSRMWGVGRVTERALHAAGVHTIGELARADPEWLEEQFGKHGPRMHDFALGLDSREVQPFRRRKSVSAETTFEEDTTDLDSLRDSIAGLAPRVSEHLRRHGLQGRTIVLKLTYRNFEHASRRTTLPRATRDAHVIAAEAQKLLERSEAGARPVRLVGVGVTALAATDGGEPPQPDFFNPEPPIRLAPTGADADLGTGAVQEDVP
jgi:DNA polymerase-4